MSIADALNDDLAAEFPAAFRALSRLGRRIYFPQGIPAQSADARGTRYNATIGQVTDGHGSPTPLPAIAAPAIIGGGTPAWYENSGGGASGAWWPWTTW